MPDRCSIPECRAISGRQHGKISVFRIPKDQALRAKWLKSIGKKNWDPGDRAVICEKHFEPSCISKPDAHAAKKSMKKSRPALLQGSLPTIFNMLTTAGRTPVESFKARVRTPTAKTNVIVTRMRNRKRRRRGKKGRDTMPLQQRANLMNAAAALEARATPATLKSQPISPTKLKVTRQSTSKTEQPEVPKAAPPPPPPVEEVCLRWNSHHSNMQTSFPSLLSKEQYCDVTLVADGKSLKCHKLILSSCSSYFEEVFEKILPYQHPVIFMKDIPFDILKSLCIFMYAGEVNIAQNDLDQLLAVAESLKIKGLANRQENKNTAPPPPVKEKEPAPQPPKVVKPAARTPITRSKTPIPSITRAKTPVPSKKNAEVTDPLDLMEPTYEEAAPPETPTPFKRSDPIRKSTGRRVKKRKHAVDDEHESSPPVFHTRKGTRSRPNVKVPRYFNASFDNSNASKMKRAPVQTAEPVEAEENLLEPLMDMVDEIKTEPVDIEDSQLSFEGDENFDMMAVETRDEFEVPASLPLAMTSRLTVVAKTEREEAQGDPLRDEGGSERSKEVARGVNDEISESTSNMQPSNKPSLENSSEATVEETTQENIINVVSLNGEASAVNGLENPSNTEATISESFQEDTEAVSPLNGETIEAETSVANHSEEEIANNLTGSNLEENLGEVIADGLNDQDISKSDHGESLQEQIADNINESEQTLQTIESNIENLEESLNDQDVSMSDQMESTEEQVKENSIEIVQTAPNVEESVGELLQDGLENQDVPLSVHGESMGEPLAENLIEIVQTLQTTEPNLVDDLNELDVSMSDISESNPT